MMAGIRSSQTGFSQIVFANITVFHHLTWATQSHLIQRGSHCPLMEDFHAYTQSLTLSLRALNCTVQASIRRVPPPSDALSLGFVSASHILCPRLGLNSVHTRSYVEGTPGFLLLCLCFPFSHLISCHTFPSVTKGQRAADCWRSTE